MDIFKERRSVRSYQDKSLKKEDLEAILEAGSYAPSGGNSQTTHRIVVLSKEVKTTLQNLVQEAFSQMEIKEDMYKSLKTSILLSKKGNYIYDYHAPVLIITANKKGYGNALADSACMIENMMLKATELGVGSCWINQLHWLTDHPKVLGKLKELGLEDDEWVTGAVALGYPTNQARKEVIRSGNKITYIE